jgi:hypothetical protein
VPSTKKIIKATLRNQGLSEDQLDRYDQTIRRVADALDASPNQDVQVVVDRAVGGDRYAVASYIRPVVQALQEARRNGSAPSRSEATVVQPSGDQPDLTEIADRLRTFASGRGLPTSVVEEALAYAGLVQDDEPEDDQSHDDSVADALDALTSAVQTLRTVLS